MTQITPYTNVISLRSRRLRTIGIALLVVLLLMSLYGIFALMPAMKSAASLYNAEIQRAMSRRSADPAESAVTIRRVRRLMNIKLLFADAYWLICGLLALGAMFIAWLDFREVARHYMTARRSIWEEAAKIPSADELRRQ